MCRLFGFRSIIQSHVHTSLTNADNALGVQAQRHPDGWGVAYYVAGIPHVVKSSKAACEDRLFKHVSGVVSSDLVIAHVRKATAGELSILNSHPFQHGRWVMAHNGDIPGFSQLRPELLSMVAPRLQRYVLGDTDSEVVFYLMLSELGRMEELHRPGVNAKTVGDAMRRALNIVMELSARQGLPAPMLTVLLSDGQNILASRYGKELHLSTHKHHCPERDVCPSFRAECETPSPKGFVSHFILSSEPLQGDNVWQGLADGTVVACDSRMRSHTWVM